MAKPRGSVKTGGRVAGVPNTTTRQMRESWASAFSAMQRGKNNLYEWAEKNPTEFYKLSIRLMPEMKADTDLDGNPTDKANYVIRIEK